MQRIRANLLIPGLGSPVSDAVVDIEGGKISYAGARGRAPAGPEPELRVPVLLPGMWDCHTHLMGSRSGGDILGAALSTPQALAGALAAHDLSRALDAGVTSVRELGGYGVQLADAIREGQLPGPAVYAAGAPISQTGGHGDVHRMPLPWVQDHCAAGGVLHLADGVDECLRAVRTQLRRGAAVVKVCASGGVLSELDHPLHQQFSDGELRAVVEEAARAERIVAAHCHGKEGIMAALRAGCRTIEHGTYLDARAADLMAETGAVLVPTRTIIAGLVGHADLPAPAADKLRRIADRHLESIALAREAGVTIASGTDLGLSLAGTPLSWGHHGAESGHLVAAGLTPAEAVAACTANGPSTLGPQAPRSGRAERGYEADLIAVTDDPLDDITVLADPGRITHVWQRGVLTKGRTEARPVPSSAASA